MGAGGIDPRPSDEVWAVERQRLEEQVKYNPAFTAQLNQISKQLPAVTDTIIKILFDKPKSKD